MSNQASEDKLRTLDDILSQAFAVSKIARAIDNKLKERSKENE